jgi:hypothetical protein
MSVRLVVMLVVFSERIESAGENIGWGKSYGMAWREGDK